MMPDSKQQRHCMRICGGYLNDRLMVNENIQETDK